MHQCYSTHMVRPLERQRYWQEVIGTAYFPLQLRFANDGDFQGQLISWQLGHLSLSRLMSTALSYQRLRQHLATLNEEQFLITIPERSEVTFAQQGRSIHCAPGGFILERSDEPYEFTYPKDNALWVVKVPGQALRSRLRAPDRFCTLRFDATQGPGALFSDYVRLIASRLNHLDDTTQALLGQQLMDLLAAALERDERVLSSQESAVRNAHLQRIERYVRQQLGNPELGPELIAAHCNISTRYLHQLFRGTGQTLGQWIREQRLLACHEQLQTAPATQSIAEIAYRWGFTDQSQFCRAFKARFGCTPKEVKERQ